MTHRRPLVLNDIKLTSQLPVDDTVMVIARKGVIADIGDPANYAGDLYVCTDEFCIYHSDGTDWNRVGKGVVDTGIVETIVAGDGIAVDSTDPGNPIITNDGIISVTAGDGSIDIDDTDPKNLVITAPAGSGVVQTIVAGTNVTVDSTDPANPIVSASGGGGGVTSVGLALPTSIFDISGSPVTGSGTLTATLDAQVKNKVFAGPITGSDAAPTFRVLDKADLKAALAAALVAGTNVTITDNGDGTFTIASSGGGGGGGIDWANPVAITTTTTVTSSGVNKVHDCTGTTADYTITLPTAGLTAGDVMAFRMGDSVGLTKLITLDATSGHVIGGGYGADTQTRIMWANEMAVLCWNGTNWRKLYGISQPMEAIAENSAGVSVPDNTVTKVSLSSLRSAPGVLYTSGRVYMPRPGRFRVTAFMSLGAVAVVPGKEAYCGIAVNSDSAFDDLPSAIAVVPTSANVTDSFAHILAATAVTLAAGDYIALLAYQLTGVTMTTRTASVVRPNMCVTEIPLW